MSETNDQTTTPAPFERQVSHLRQWRHTVAASLRRLEDDEINLQAKLDKISDRIDADRALIAELDAAVALLEGQGR
ncbi:MAG: hypothetical protein K0S43_386 [Cellulosimicrobium sp.]|jgi:hypothetical protein|nr:hypothetical protein [Cellulosimicrobium sp.]